MKQLTLRQIPDAVEKKLRLKAAEDCQSLNKTAIHALARGLGINENTVARRDLTKIAGRWSKEDLLEFERNTTMFQAIDEEMWQ